MKLQMKSRSKGQRRAVLAALFCALIFAATWISVPAGLGNVNLGDAMILSTACLLGGPWAVVAAGAGAALTDLLSGYAVYASGTLVIKALMVLAMLGMLRLLSRLPLLSRRLIAGVVAETVMVTGYFLYECFFLSYGSAAWLSVPLNALQGGVGILVSLLVCTAISHAMGKETLDF